MDKDIIKQKIDNHKDIRRNLWTAIIVLTGGIATLLLSLDSFIKIILIVIGSIADVALINGIINNNESIAKLFYFLDKEEQL